MVVSDVDRDNVLLTDFEPSIPFDDSLLLTVHIQAAYMHNGMKNLAISHSDSKKVLDTR